MAFVTLLLVACITFFLMNAIPGNPWLSEKTPSEATIQALNAKYGLYVCSAGQVSEKLGTGRFWNFHQDAEEPSGSGNYQRNVPGICKSR